ncbi:18882_t:CDS:1, partial [Racocetra fulgida]
DTQFIEFDKPILLMKGLKVVKRNILKFYKTVAEELIWLSLNYENKQISVDEASLKDKILKVISKYTDEDNVSLELFKLTAKYDLTTNQHVSAKNFFNMEERKEK